MKKLTSRKKPDGLGLMKHEASPMSALVDVHYLITQRDGRICHENPDYILMHRIQMRTEQRIRRDVTTHDFVDCTSTIQSELGCMGLNIATRDGEVW